MTNKHFFIGGQQGQSTVTAMSAYRGAGLAAVERVDIVNAEQVPAVSGAGWPLAGFTSTVRYATGAGGSDDRRIDSNSEVGELVGFGAR